jgi:hypothetical protein
MVADVAKALSGIYTAAKRASAPDQGLLAHWSPSRSRTVSPNVDIGEYSVSSAIAPPSKEKVVVVTLGGQGTLTVTVSESPSPKCSCVAAAVTSA